MNLNFNSFEFIFGFLPIFVMIYYATPAAYRNITLLGGSLLFYGLGNPGHLCILILALLINYGFGRQIRTHHTNCKHAKAWLTAMIIFNLLLLGTFKYSSLLQPLGISFYTFQMMSYGFDLYAGRITEEPSLLSMAVYICMFPKLGSGPLISYAALAEQWKKKRRNNILLHMEKGMKTFTLGLAAKVLLADTLGILWNDVQIIGFRSITVPMAWLGAVAFSLQLYFDFWGYSLMAVGLGEILGFSLPENFHMPYMAKSVSDFYRRWHMTLGRWFRDYVYIPLGGNQKGKVHTCRNLLFVWLLTGVWHGTGWNFLLWGLTLGILIVLEKLSYGKWLERSSILGHLYVLTVIPITWMMFAVRNLEELLCYLSRMFGQGTAVATYAGDAMGALENYSWVLGFAVLFCTPLPQKLYKKFEHSAVMVVGLLLLFWICIYRMNGAQSNPFMYLQF